MESVKEIYSTELLRKFKALDERKDKIAESLIKLQDKLKTFNKE